MARQVRIVAILQIVQGVAEFVWGITFGLSPGDVPRGGSDDILVALLIVGLLISLGGGFRAVTGILNLTYRGRRLGIVALLLGTLSSISCCC